jgi:hypothetical protein
MPLPNSIAKNNLIEWQVLLKQLMMIDINEFPFHHKLKNEG